MTFQALDEDGLFGQVSVPGLAKEELGELSMASPRCVDRSFVTLLSTPNPELRICLAPEDVATLSAPWLGQAILEFDTGYHYFTDFEYPMSNLGYNGFTMIGWDPETYQKTVGGDPSEIAVELQTEIRGTYEMTLTWYDDVCDCQAQSRLVITYEMDPETQTVSKPY